MMFISQTPESFVYRIYQNYQDFLQEITSGLNDPITAIILFFLFIFWGYFCSYIATYFKMKRNLQVGYTRKIFHFLVFTSAAAIHFIWGFWGVILFGSVISVYVFKAVYGEETSSLYNALAREKDSPHKTKYILIPYFSTLFGGIMLNLITPDYATLGYLICGVADASGEVVGTMFGKHSFKVKTIGKQMPEKSIEGSASVFALTSLIYILFTYSVFEAFTSILLALLLVCSFIITLVEIYSPKGYDNFTIQVFSVLVYVTVIP